MGWKILKQHFGIGHIVQIRDGKLLIGSPYVSELASILKTGELVLNKIFEKSFREEYPNLVKASPEYLKDLLDQEDTFERSIPIYTYKGLHILKKQCEGTEYPSVTHDGVLIDGDFSESIDGVIELAQLNRTRRINGVLERIDEVDQDLQSCRHRLAELEAQELVCGEL